MPFFIKPKKTKNAFFSKGTCLNKKKAGPCQEWPPERSTEVGYPNLLPTISQPVPTIFSLSLSLSLSLSIYIYMKPARGPQTMFFCQWLLWNHCRVNWNGAWRRCLLSVSRPPAILKSRLVADVLASRTICGIIAVHIQGEATCNSWVVSVTVVPRGTVSDTTDPLALLGLGWPPANPGIQTISNWA